jgi:hypothetical protein
MGMGIAGLMEITGAAILSARATLMVTFFCHMIKLL